MSESRLNKILIGLASAPIVGVTLVMDYVQMLTDEHVLNIFAPIWMLKDGSEISQDDITMSIIKKCIIGNRLLGIHAQNDRIFMDFERCTVFFDLSKAGETLVFNYKFSPVEAVII